MDRWLKERRVVEWRRDQDRIEAGGAGEKRAASRESGRRDQEVQSEEVRRHESIREYTRV